jgi:hypothetical protein
MHDDASFLADAADIRWLLAGTDPVPDALGAVAATRMSRIRDGITGTDLKVGHLRSGPRRRRALAAAGAGAGIAAVAVAASVTGLMLGANPPQANQGGPVTAAQLLSKIGDRAARAPQQRVTDSQFEYIASQVYDRPGDGHRVPGRTHLRQVWIPVADLCGPGLLIERGRKTSLADPADAVPAPVGHQKKAVVRSNATISWTPDKEHCPNPGGLNDPTYRVLQSLPASPRAMLKVIYAGRKAGLSADEEAFTTIGDLLHESVAPPKVSAALYRAAALIPGVTAIPDAVDAIGRPGFGISYTFHGYKQEWIFDKTTLQLLGERDFINGTLTDKSAIITRAFTNRPGEVPPSG